MTVVAKVAVVALDQTGRGRGPGAREGGEEEDKAAI